MDAISRRSFVKHLSAAGALAYSGRATAADLQEGTPARDEAVRETATRARRMAWWHAAKFGMCIHWGLYSVLGRHEWAMEAEGIPISQYEKLADHFHPKPGAAREWAKLARRSGQKYMVMTAKHHEGFCMFETQLTDYCSSRRGPMRDLVREFVEAARAQGLGVGLYYSLMDWHHPDGARCKTDEAARKRFVAYTHGLIRELMSNYGKIDILWYDQDLPLSPEQWESERMNRTVFELQPEIIVNNRNGMEGDFSTPEQHVLAAAPGRSWETCMTLNESWGFNQGDDAWKTPKTIVSNLAACAAEGGNYLLNIGPKADGSVPDESVEILDAVGKWLRTNGDSIYASERGAFNFHPDADFTRRGNILYVQVKYWPGQTPAGQWMPFFEPGAVLGIGGLRAKVKSARLLKTGASILFVQDRPLSLRLCGLPLEAPDAPLTVIEVECDGEPIIDGAAMAFEWPR